ncbi:MAG: serine/threonine protein phosphatase [Nitrospirae bacterium RBG_13_39_12]|nr:MAG: serine/threonine protein phosphatase [Nitrospirae bacterium RBG_13_39_12]
MLKNRGIAFKLIFLITLSSALIFLLIFSYNYYASRRMIEKNVEENAKNLAFSTVNRIEIVLRSVQKVTENIACFLENSTCKKEDLLQFLQITVENNPEIYGSTVAFEPYALDKKLPAFAPYFYKENGKIRLKNLQDVFNYNYFILDWYQIPKELNRSIWSEPYFDEGAGNIMMSTYSVPFYKHIKGDRQFIGIVTADVSLEWLREMLLSIKILKTGYAFLISKNGTIISHYNKELIMNETIFSVAENRGDALLREIGRKMVRGESGFVPFRSIVRGRPCWMYYAPIPSSGWSIAVIFPKDELTEDIVHLNRTVIFLGITGILLLSIAVVLNTRSITKQLREMSQAAERIGTGNLDIELPPVKSGDEVGKLTAAFHYMKTSLKEYIQKLTETTAAKERIESELKIASEIQMGILPKTFPPFPDRKEFDIFATIKPAKEVGGDFYDFFFIDHDHLCFIIADVSGKGVPAALFMAVARTLIKAVAVPDMPPGDLLTKVNEELCIGNESSMFVTIFCGILNTKTGEVLYTNAGHNPPLILQKDNNVIWLEGERNIFIGAMKQVNYKTDRIVLHTGDALFMYTDGVTEAMNEREEQFTSERLKKEVTDLYGRYIKEIVAGIMEKVVSFAHGAQQSDDITMMIVEFRGDQTRDKLSF